MTDLREVMARAIARAELGDADQSAIELFWPRFEKHYDAVLRAIEAAGYAIVPRALAVTTDADAVAAARFASLEDTTLLAKET